VGKEKFTCWKENQWNLRLSERRRKWKESIGRSDLYRKAALFAKAKGTELNKIVSEALEKYLST
jgi:hypothetical protein